MEDRGDSPPWFKGGRPGSAGGEAVDDATDAEDDLATFRRILSLLRVDALTCEANALATASWVTDC